MRASAWAPSRNDIKDHGISKEMPLSFAPKASALCCALLAAVLLGPAPLAAQSSESASDAPPPIRLSPDYPSGDINGNVQPSLGVDEDYVVDGIEGAGKAVQAADILGRIEGYMNSIKTLHAHFEQIASDGSYATGLMVLDRPGRMRFEYDPPHPVLMIATSGTLVYYDRELEEATYIPVSQTPVWFLLRDDITFGDPLQVVELKRRGNSYLLSLVEEGELDQGTVTLQFQVDPLKLERWQIIDGQGTITQITLLDPKFNRDVGDHPFDISVFKDRFPQDDGPGQ
ncbi:MAG: outer membrane lipoprotein carrier protein LolA [Limibacillus sp.]|jgi:outer membrane lipoprotein-sorting protein